jgi:hypothetical protein
MNTRFATSLTLAAAGAVVVVSSQTFATGTTAWIAFGIGIASLALAGASAPFGRHLAEHAIDGLTYLLAAWTIVASLVFSGSTVLWLSFAEGAALFGLALASHVLNEVRVTAHVHEVEAEVETIATRPAPVGVAA